MTPAGGSTADVLSRAIGASVELRDRGPDEAQVLAPFRFPDGDHLVIYLRRLGDQRCAFSDAGHTYMHLSYSIDVDALRSGPEAARVQSVLSRFGVRDDDGELFASTDEQALATTFLGYVQALIGISDLAAKRTM